MGNTYGYVRVSSRDQNEDRQIDAMNQLKIAPKNIYMDKQSGKDFNRPSFQRMIADIEAGKVGCVVTKDDCVIIEPTQKDLENQGFVAGSICF